MKVENTKEKKNTKKKRGGKKKIKHKKGTNVSRQGLRSEDGLEGLRKIVDADG